MKRTNVYYLLLALWLLLVKSTHGFATTAHLGSSRLSTQRLPAFIGQDDHYQERGGGGGANNPQSSDLTATIDTNCMNRRQVMRSVAATTTTTVLVSLSSSLVPPATAAYIDPQTNPPTVTHQVFLDVQIGSKEPPQRIVLDLYGKLMPRTVDHFVGLCANNGYAGTFFYRILSDYNIQGGGNSKGLAPDAAILEPDNFDLQHTAAGLISMVRATPAGGMDQRFFIQCTADGGLFDDRYAVFGIVANDDSMEIVRQVEQVPVKRPANAPTTPVTIVGSGVLSSSS